MPSPGPARRRSRRQGTQSDDDHQLLPFLPTDQWINIASFLDVRSLGRMACVELRFSVPSVPDPTHAHRLRLAEHWTLIEEGARQALAKHGKGELVPRLRKRESWLKLLNVADMLLTPLVFTIQEPSVTISSDGENMPNTVYRNILM